MSHNLVLLDTNIFALLFISPKVAEKRFPVEEWRAALTGRRVVIAFQTQAELLYGAVKDKWGPSRRQRLDQLFRETPTVWADDEVVRAEATLRNVSEMAGHPLAAPVHTADRWIGACAVAKSLPLWSLDHKAFADAPLIQRFDAAPR